MNLNNFKVIIKKSKSKKNTIKLKVNLNNEIILIGKKLTYETCLDIINKNIDYVNNCISKNNSLRELYSIDLVKEFRKIWLFGNLFDIVQTEVEEENFKTEFTTLKIYSSKLSYSKLITITRDYFSLIVRNSFFEKVKTVLGNDVCITLKFKDIVSKYGYCMYKKNEVVLSKRIIHLPFNVINYIIIHELCHFKIHNHSKSFYNEVIKYCSDYKICEKELKKFSYIFSQS